jgi:hypothetical protein
MHSLSRVVIAVSMLTLGSPGVTMAQPGVTRHDRQGPVTVALTILSSFGAEAPLKLRIALDTHSVGLDDVALESAVALRSADGADIPPAAVEQATGGGHHRQAVVIFPPISSPRLRIVVKNVGGVSERLFDWDLSKPR